MRYVLFALLAIVPFLGQAQEQFILSLDEFQVIEDPSTSLQSQMRFPRSEKMIVMGGLDNLDGMGNYFNVYGSKLIVDRRKTRAEGGYALTLRREDGRDFFDLFPTLSGKLIPVTQLGKIEVSTQ